MDGGSHDESGDLSTVHNLMCESGAEPGHIQDEVPAGCFQWAAGSSPPAPTSTKLVIQDQCQIEWHEDDEERLVQVHVGVHQTSLRVETLKCMELRIRVM